MAEVIDRRCGTGWRLALGLALLLVGASVPVHCLAVDSFKSGNTLLADCNDNDLFNKGFCMGYIIGIADVIAVTTINGYRACIPNGVTQGQMQDVVVKWLRANPQDRHYTARGLVAEALETAFPCK